MDFSSDKYVVSFLVSLISYGLKYILSDIEMTIPLGSWIHLLEIFYYLVHPEVMAIIEVRVFLGFSRITDHVFKSNLLVFSFYLGIETMDVESYQ